MSPMIKGCTHWSCKPCVSTIITINPAFWNRKHRRRVLRCLWRWARSSHLPRSHRNWTQARGWAETPSRFHIAKGWKSHQSVLKTTLTPTHLVHRQELLLEPQQLICYVAPFRSQLKSYAELQWKAYFSIRLLHFYFCNIPLTTTILMLPQAILNLFPILFSICTLVERKSHSQD